MFPRRHGCATRLGAARSPATAAGLAALSLALFTGCAPARYVVLPADAGAEAAVDPDQRCIWLAPSDAVSAASVVGLSSSNVRGHPRGRLETGSAVERLLYLFLSGAYDEAERSLASDGLPDYLRLVVAADLASERSRAERPATDVVRLYQAAYDAQETERGRATIELRVRQLRYGR